MTAPINKGQFTLESPEREQAFERNRGFGVEEAYRENRRQWTEYPKQQIVSPYPPHVDVEISSRCNLRCPMCYTTTEAFKSKVNKQFMDLDLFKKIVDELAQGEVFSIRLSWRGESFIHPDVIECIRYAKQKGIKEVSTLTNGFRLDEELFTQAMEAGIDWITISIDGLGAMYEQIRKPATFERALEKIRNYARIKREAGRIKPVIKVQSILPAVVDNLDEYYSIFSPVTDMVSANPLIDYLHKDDPGKIVYDEAFVCPQLYQRLAVGADGKYMLCMNDTESEYVIGDARTDSILKVWHGEPLTRARESHRLHRGVKDYPICARCYLPRKTQGEEITVNGRTTVAENYLGRSQKIGT